VNQSAIAPYSRVELGLTGMTCAACAARIEKSLNRVPGVRAAVNFATETANVGYDPAVASPEQMIAAVARAGYGASVHRDPEEDRRRDQARRAVEYAALKREFVLAALLTAPLLAQMVPMLASGSLFASAHADLLPRLAQLLLATPVQFWIGRRFYIGAWHAVRGGGANMDVLVVLGTTMAFGALPLLMVTRALLFGRSLPSGLGRVIHSSTARLCGSAACPTRLTVPCKVTPGMESG